MNKTEQLLKKLAEETIYSAKGHFKSSDIRIFLIKSTIWITALFGVLGMIIEGEVINKFFSAIGLFGSIALLLWNEGEEKNYQSEHKKNGEKYLSLHKELRDLYYIKDIKSDMLQNISDNVKELDKSTKPNISYLGRKLSQRAIQKNNETDNWYKEL